MNLIPPIPSPEILPDTFTLGETDAEIPLHTAKDNQEAALQLASQAKLHLAIYSQNLDPAVYDNEDFRSQLVRIARNHRQASIRILVQDSSIAVRQGHALIRVAQSLTTHVTVHQIPRFYQNVTACFLVADRVGLLYRNDVAEFTGSANFNSPPRAQKLLEHFDEVWRQSEPEPQFRRLYI